VAYILLKKEHSFKIYFDDLYCYILQSYFLVELHFFLFHRPHVVKINVMLFLCLCGVFNSAKL